MQSPKYRDSATLQLAAEINDFVRTKTNNLKVGSVALEAAVATFSLVEWPESVCESPERPQQEDQELVASAQASE